MPKTFKLIASNTVGVGGSSAISFTGIPSTYTDLCIKFSVRRNQDSADTVITFNGSSANVSSKYIYGTGSAMGGATAASNIYSLATRSSNTSNTFASGEIYITNYASTSNSKSISKDVVTENNSTEAFQYLTAGLFSSNSAISTVTIAPTTGLFDQNSTAYLYGISNS